MWTAVLKSASATVFSMAGPPLHMIAAATSVPAMLTAVVRQGFTVGLASALYKLAKLGTLMFIGLFLIRCGYAVRDIYDAEVSATVISCDRHYACLQMAESLKAQPAHKDACDKDRIGCFRNPWDRAFQRATDIFPAWSDFVRDVQDRLLLICVFAYMGHALANIIQALSAPGKQYVQATRQQKLARRYSAQVDKVARDAGMDVDVDVD